MLALTGIALPIVTASATVGHCHKTFTLKMFERAADYTYAGIRTPSRGAYGRLGRYARCQRPPSSEARARTVWGRERAAWKLRRNPPAPPMSYATASWYNDAGQTASGWHSYYGVADCGSGGGPCYGFGTRIEFCYHGCVTATVDDHGPYIAGRAFDLNQNTAAAIGFDGVGVGTVDWRIAG